MKVLMHLNHGVNKSYMIDFGSSVTHRDVTRLLTEGEDKAVKSLLCYASIRKANKIEVTGSSRRIRKAACQADFTVSQHGYTAQRLA